MKKEDYWGEIWMDYRESDWREDELFKISNFGRIKSFKVNKTDGKLMPGSNLNGYLTLNATRKNGKNISRYIHKIVAELFLTKGPDAKYVLHLDYDKSNNHVDNLKWATLKEKTAHHSQNPERLKFIGNPTNAKLTESKVKLIKKKLNDPNRKTRMKMIAKQFGISEMQLWRIKSGENWGYVKADED